MLLNCLLNIWVHILKVAITSKAAFKIMARELTHTVLESKVKVSSEQVKHVVSNLFIKNANPVTEDQAKAFVIKFALGCVELN